MLVALPAGVPVSGMVGNPGGIPVGVIVDYSAACSAFRDEARAGFVAAMAVGSGGGSDGASTAAEGGGAGWAVAARGRADRVGFEAAVVGGDVESWVGAWEVDALDRVAFGVAGCGVVA